MKTADFWSQELNVTLEGTWQEIDIDKVIYMWIFFGLKNSNRDSCRPIFSIFCKNCKEEEKSFKKKTVPQFGIKK